MNLAQILLPPLLLALLASARAPPPAARRLLRCPAEFAALVEPLPAAPDLQPVLTAGPGVRLRTVRFLRDSALRLDSAGRLWLSGRVSNSSAGSGFSGPHVLLCSDTERRGLATFSLFVRLAPGRGDGNESAVAEATENPAVSEHLAEATETPTASEHLAKATETPSASEHLAEATGAPASAFASSRAARRFDDPLFAALAAASSLLLLTCVGLAVALAAVTCRFRTRRGLKGLKGPIYRPPAGGSADPLFQQGKERRLFSAEV